MNQYKKNLIRTLYALICGFFFLSFISCDNTKEEPNNKEKDKSQTTILIYAVATNSLTGNLISDKNEMLEAASQIDLEKNNVLIFETQYKYLEDNTKVRNVCLLKLVKTHDGDNYSWEVIKEYNDGIASLNPSRITEIIDNVITNYEAENYGLVFWSHSTASQPYFTDIDTRTDFYSETDSPIASLPLQYSFGQDLTIVNGDPYYQINIDELANSIPDHLFDYIWFDSCYMSNIETIYEFRNKCDIFVGYPTEVLDSGLPYQNVLPYLVGDSPDPVMAAKKFFEYYSNSFGTIAVIDIRKIHNILDFCKNTYTKTNIDKGSLTRYSRYTTGPFYDLGDYTKALSEVNGNELVATDWDMILDSFVLYKETTSGSLLGLSIDPERYSGISTHLYSFKEDPEEEETLGEKYYKSLDWFNAVF